MPRIIALDYGSKRVGIAVSDPLQMIATGLTTVHPKEIVHYLKTYISKEEVSCFVVGEPRQMDNSPSEISKQVEQFVKLLQQKFPAVPIKRMDERFTSKMAMQTLVMSGIKKKERQNKALIDEVSATIILQSYLEMTK